MTTNCPGTKHRIILSEDEAYTCLGISFSEFDNLTTCEYREFCQTSLNSYKPKEHETNRIQKNQ